MALKSPVESSQSYMNVFKSFLFVKAIIYFRTSPPDVLLGKDTLKICSKFTGKHLCGSAISENLSLRQPLDGCF